MKRFTQIFALLLALVMMFGLVACGNTDAPAADAPAADAPAADAPAADKPAADAAEPLGYTFLDAVHASQPYGYDNPDDIVTPWVEEKFGISVSEVIHVAGQTPMEQINMMVAAGNLPDVVLVTNNQVASAYATGAFADLSEYVGVMTETDKYISDTGWNSLSVDGKVVAIPYSSVEMDSSNAEIMSMIEGDLYYTPNINWTWVIQEDILTKLGYEFTSMADLQAELDAKPRAITDKDVALNPAIDSFEDFEALLYAIKDLNLTVDGKPVYPLSVPEWGLYHISALFSRNGGYMYDPATGETSGYIMNPGQKEFYKIIVKWLQDGILDPDFLIQKTEQYQEKVQSGRVAVTFQIPDVTATRNALKAASPTNDLHPFDWPGAPVYSDKSYVDPSYPGGYYNIMINKDMKGEDIERLLAYFDWFQTEEAKLIGTWGPESAGLYTTDANGNRVWADDAFYQAISTGGETPDGVSAEKLGLFDKFNLVSYWTSKAFLCAPGPILNNESWVYSYPTEMDAYTSVYAYISTAKLCRDGTVLPANGEASSACDGYYWGVTKLKMAELFDTKNDAEFDAAWDSIVADFVENGGYEAAIAEMAPLFENLVG